MKRNSMAPGGTEESFTSQHEARWRRIRRLSHVLDTSLRLPGTTYRFGVDSLLGLIPGIGDSLGLLLSSYILFEAKNLGAPPSLLWRMAMNIGIDTLVGTIPLLGDVFDVVWKANTKNMALLQEYFSKHPARP